MHIDLHPREVGRGVLVGVVQQLADALGAPVAKPVAAEEYREIWRRNAVIGVHQTAAGRGDIVWQLVAGRPADPVMRPVPWHGADPSPARRIGTRPVT